MNFLPLFFHCTGPVVIAQLTILVCFKALARSARNTKHLRYILNSLDCVLWYILVTCNIWLCYDFSSVTLTRPSFPKQNDESKNTKKIMLVSNHFKLRRFLEKTHRKDFRVNHQNIISWQLGLNKVNVSLRGLGFSPPVKTWKSR